MSLSLQLGECVGFVLPNARVYPSTEINIDVEWLDNIDVEKGQGCIMLIYFGEVPLRINRIWVNQIFTLEYNGIQLT